MQQNQNWIVGLETSSISLISCEGLRVNPSAHFLPQNGRTTHLGQGLPKSIALQKQSTGVCRRMEISSCESTISEADHFWGQELSAPPDVCSFPQNWKSNCPSAPQTPSADSSQITPPTGSQKGKWWQIQPQYQQFSFELQKELFFRVKSLRPANPIASPELWSEIHRPFTQKDGTGNLLTCILLGGWPTPLKKNEFVSWGWDDIPYMKWKIKKCLKPPTRSSFICDVPAQTTI